jgi:hypothetical protein
VECTADAQCDDGNDCSDDFCDAGQCRHEAALGGTILDADPPSGTLDARQPQSKEGDPK